MIQVDGSFGEGGGQIVRTSAALSALTGQPVTVYNIRKKRPQPGLKTQHLVGIGALAEFCGAETQGLSLGSEKLVFVPGEIRDGRLKIRIPTAGSISLVLQTLMVPAMFCGKKLEVFFEGGATNTKWSPPIDYLRNVFLPVLEKFGYRGKISVLRRGFYPKGGAEVEAVFKHCELSEINLSERGEMKETRGVAFSSRLPEHVVDRISEYARKKLFKHGLEAKIEKQRSEAESPGAGLVLWTEFENTVLGGDSLGEPGLRSEKLGENAAENLVSEISSDACLDTHFADQVIPFLALAGGKVSVRKKTKHLETNMWVAEKFFGKIFETRGNTINCRKKAL